PSLSGRDRTSGIERGARAGSRLARSSGRSGPAPRGRGPASAEAQSLASSDAGIGALRAWPLEAWAAPNPSVSGGERPAQTPRPIRDEPRKKAITVRNIGPAGD